MHERRTPLTNPSDPASALVPVAGTSSSLALPDIVRHAGEAAVFATEEFFYGGGPLIGGIVDGARLGFGATSARRRNTARTRAMSSRGLNGLPR